MLTLVKYVLIAVVYFIVQWLLGAFISPWFAMQFIPVLMIVCTGIIVHHIKQLKR
ncbi:MAG: hypothetical protein IJY39_01495 [Clostridia bacterium]|nr:hypothetical protein [Clostridia bacterium]